LTTADARAEPPRATTRSLRAALVGAALTAAIALAAAVPTPAPAGSKPPPQPRPNVLVIMTDDQTVSQFTPEVMPKTFRKLAEGGTIFDRSFVSSPLCCPSRAGFLTGQYAHNNGVFDNTPGYAALLQKDRTLFTWLRAAGYHTGHVGRFLLGYDTQATTPADPYGTPPPASPNPPGVDDWYGYDDYPTHYFSAPFSDNGNPTSSATSKHGYITRAIDAQARDFIAQSAPSPEPFFLWLAEVAPHSTNDPPRAECSAGAPATEPGTYRQWADAELPEPPSFNEESIHDKPAWLRFRRPLRAGYVKAIRRSWRCALASLSSVDRGVASIVNQLRQLGELDDTAIFFTSDNGLFYGEHRVVLQKLYPYDEALRVPLLAHIPPTYLGGDTPPRTISAPVTNVDLTATILALAGAPPCDEQGRCRTLDGRSLLPLLGGPGPAFPKQRAILSEVGNRICGTVPIPGLGIKNQYDAIRTRNQLYVELNRRDPGTGACDRPEYELYDLTEDPFQLKNIAVNPANKTPSELQAGLANRLHELARCAGVAGRDPQTLEGEYQTPRPYCE
jgi:N-acetylglucosamine-6-sulfatase